MIAVEDIKSLRSKYEDVFQITLQERDDKILNTKLNAIHIKNNVYQITISNNYREFFKELQNFKVIKIESIKQSIEDIFMKYYGDDQNE